MKRRDFERHLRSQGCALIDEGGNHSRWSGPEGKGRSAVPRHRELGTGLVRKICRDLGVPPPTGSR